MNDIELRAAYVFVVMACLGCGSGGTNDFFSDRSENGGGGAQPGGTGGAVEGGSSGAQQGGSGGTPQAGAAGTGQGGIAGAAGAASGAGTVSGGTSAGVGGLSAGSGGAKGGTGGTVGTGGTGLGSFSCGSLMCAEGRQFCRRTAMSGGSEQRMCQPIPDSCVTFDCSCFCNSSQATSCEQGQSCMCSGDAGRVTVVCAGN